MSQTQLLCPISLTSPSEKAQLVDPVVCLLCVPLWPGPLDMGPPPSEPQK